MKTLRISQLEEGRAKTVRAKESTTVEIFPGKCQDTLTRTLKPHDTLYIWLHEGKVDTVVFNQPPLLLP